ncbi:hypothetical protein [Desulfosporosinus sp. FKA]|nr:hypothetical protein [Desulfosporosinus sp. FKA]
MFRVDRAGIASISAAQRVGTGVMSFDSHRSLDGSALALFSNKAK